MTHRILLCVMVCMALPHVAVSKVCDALHDRSACGLSSVKDQYTMTDGKTVPAFAFGTAWKLVENNDTYQVVKDAIEAGYRHFDTAQFHKNLREVGRAIKDSGLPRSMFFISVRLYVLHHHHEYGEAVENFLKMFQKLDNEYIGYVDALMPVAIPSRLIEAWDAILSLQTHGLVRSVMVANFDVPHLEALEAHGRPLPTANQIDINPLTYWKMKPVVEWCERKGILVQAYGLSRPEKFMQNPILNGILAAHPGKTIRNVMGRWALQKGFGIVMGSSNKAHLKENMNIFDFVLSAVEMAALVGWELSPAEKAQNVTLCIWDETSGGIPNWGSKPDIGDTDKFLKHWNPEKKEKHAEL